MAAGIPYGDLSAYLDQGGGLSSLFGEGGLGGLLGGLNPWSAGLEALGLIGKFIPGTPGQIFRDISNPIQGIEDLIGALNGLPANVKPDNAASYLESLKQYPLSQIEGKLIANAEKAAGGNAGVLSEDLTNPRNFNPYQDAAALEILTGQNAFPKQTAKGTANIVHVPPGGGAQQGLNLSVKDYNVLNAKNQLGLGPHGEGFTPQELNNPKAERIIQKFMNDPTKGLGIGGHLGLKNITALTKALEAAGIMPNGDLPQGNPQGGNKPPNPPDPQNPPPPPNFQDLLQLFLKILPQFNFSSGSENPRNPSQRQSSSPFAPAPWFSAASGVNPLTFPTPDLPVGTLNLPARGMMA